MPGVAAVGGVGRRELRARVHTRSGVVGPTWAVGWGGDRVCCLWRVEARRPPRDFTVDVT